MTKGWKVWFLVLLVICVGLEFWLYPTSDSMLYSTTSQIRVVSKGEEGTMTWIKGYNPNLERKAEVRIIVKDRNTWNLISDHETYFITYHVVDDREPVLIEITPAK